MEYCLPLNNGLRKRRSTRDCLALLMTDISTSLEMKEQTVVAFLDASGAYDIFFEFECVY
jgi:hypothetical protein